MSIAQQTVARMHPEDLERLADLVADRVAECLDVRTRRRLVDVRTLAAEVGVSPDFVREHAEQLGGFRITDSPKAPWRFDVAQARERMAARAPGKRSGRTESRHPVRRSASSNRRREKSAGRTLAIRGEAA